MKGGKGGGGEMGGGVGWRYRHACVRVYVCCTLTRLYSAREVHVTRDRRSLTLSLSLSL